MPGRKSKVLYTMYVGLQQAAQEVVVWLGVINDLQAVSVPRQEPQPRPATSENGCYVIYAPNLGSCPHADRPPVQPIVWPSSPLASWPRAAWAWPSLPGPRLPTRDIPRSSKAQLSSGSHHQGVATPWVRSKGRNRLDTHLRGT